MTESFNKEQLEQMLQAGAGMLNAPAEVVGGGDDPITKEMKELANRKLGIDNKTPIELSASAAQRVGINPAFLFSSAMQEGMNKAIAKPDMQSDAYLDLYESGKLDGNTFPVDGFYNYGLDTFADRADKLIEKGYLPKDFKSQFAPFQAKNEQGGLVNTAAFRNHESALMAKAAILKDIQDEVSGMAKKKGVELQPKHLDYLSLAYYNARRDSANKLFDEFIAAKDKDSFIDKGETTMQGVHKNISPRVARMLAASEYFKTTTK
jgi:hypothetical protein